VSLTSFELVADGFSFPTGIALDPAGVIYVVESGVPFAGAAPAGRIWRLEHGERRLVVDGLRGPVTGLVFHEGHLIVSEGGHPARISRCSPAGQLTPVLEGLPGPGNYHVSPVAVGRDGRFFFAQGSMTNSGVIGLDALELGWLRRLPHAADVPGHDLILAGVNHETADPDREGRQTSTGGFVPFGCTTRPGQRIPRKLPCTAAVMSCDADGRDLTLVAWGIRNAFGLGFLSDGRLLALDQGADERGSRPLAGVPDLLFEVRPGAFYGWPDFVDGEPITLPRFRADQGPAPRFLLANHHELPRPERALVRFAPHVSATRFDEVPAAVPVLGGKIVVALFGDERPMTVPGGGPAGRALALVDPRDWTAHPGPEGPLARPIDVRWSVAEGCLYVLDFGRFEMTADRAVRADPASGALWRLRITI
jgi:hypothetical protein